MGASRAGSASLIRWIGVFVTTLTLFFQKAWRMVKEDGARRFGQGLSFNQSHASGMGLTSRATKESHPVPGKAYGDCLFSNRIGMSINSRAHAACGATLDTGVARPTAPGSEMSTRRSHAFPPRAYNLCSGKWVNNHPAWHRASAALLSSKAPNGSDWRVWLHEKPAVEGYAMDGAGVRVPFSTECRDHSAKANVFACLDYLENLHNKKQKNGQEESLSRATRLQGGAGTFRNHMQLDQRYWFMTYAISAAVAYSGRAAGKFFPRLAGGRFTSMEVGARVGKYAVAAAFYAKLLEPDGSPVAVLVDPLCLKEHWKKMGQINANVSTRGICAGLRGKFAPSPQVPTISLRTLFRDIARVDILFYTPQIGLAELIAPAFSPILRHKVCRVAIDKYDARHSTAEILSAFKGLGWHLSCLQKKGGSARKNRNLRGVVVDARFGPIVSPHTSFYFLAPREKTLGSQRGHACHGVVAAWECDSWECDAGENQPTAGCSVPDFLNRESLREVIAQDFGDLAGMFSERDFHFLGEKR
ncbi:unnamed protein product [Amoebophrya sp. A25]|nr:unnamed protein product [Amoebophrya sp. A25]|eukprot:GSA25T00023411001.1